MPAFTFEKLSNSKRGSAKTPPAPITERRSIVASLLDRMTKARLQKADRNFVRFESCSSDKDKV
ncbi:MAG: hypothetical protein EOO82_03750 [Oxalobacteraceae bacterium]|nr:MAG: hypothetical protein EOO82_03750 [Oxalobacteraceae bacterium]